MFAVSVIDKNDKYMASYQDEVLLVGQDLFLANAVANGCFRLVIFKGKLFSNNGNKVFTTKSVMSLDFFHVSGKSKI